MGLPSLAEIANGLSDLTMDFVNNANLTLRTGLEAHEAVTGIRTLGWANDRAIQQVGDERRSDLYSEQERESLVFGGGYEPPTVQMENFEAMSHEQMKAAVDSTNPGSMLDDARAWRNAAEQVQVTVTAFNVAIRGAIEGGWEGKGAESARATIASYATQSLRLEHAARLVANKIEEAHTGIDQARQRMPEPESGSALDAVRGTVATLNPIGGLMAAFHKSESARQHAVQVMTTEYAPVVLQADSKVPILPVPHGPSGGGVDVDPSIDQTSGSSSVATGSGIHSASGANTAAMSYGTTHPMQFGGSESVIDPSGTAAAKDARTDHTVAVPDPSEALTDTAGATNASATAPASSTHQTDPAAATRASTLPGGTSPTSLGSGGGAIPVGSGGTGTPAGPGLVAPLAHGTQATQSTSAAMQVSGGRPATVGMGGGFLPPGARPGNEDSEHDTPEYLLNVANGNELIGRLPKVAPPVLGG